MRHRAAEAQAEAAGGGGGDVTPEEAWERMRGVVFGCSLEPLTQPTIDRRALGERVAEELRKNPSVTAAEYSAEKDSIVMTLLPGEYAVTVTL